MYWNVACFLLQLFHGRCRRKKKEACRRLSCFFDNRKGEKNERAVFICLLKNVWRKNRKEVFSRHNIWGRTKIMSSFLKLWCVKYWNTFFEFWPYTDRITLIGYKNVNDITPRSSSNMNPELGNRMPKYARGQDLISLSALLDIRSRASIFLIYM